MPFVLDASIPACWALQDEEDPRADTAFARIKSDEAVVPSLWWFEIRNILVVNDSIESDTAFFCEIWQGCGFASIGNRRRV